jgi:hypothetical protein
MADHRHDGHGHDGGYDSELHVRTILAFCGGVLGVTVLALAVMWWMSVAFKHQEEANDRPPSPLEEARIDPIPPGPRLQPAPPHDMEELRARDREALTTYGWIDQAGGVARIPVERAISLLTMRGLPPSTTEKGLAPSTTDKGLAPSTTEKGAPSPVEKGLPPSRQGKGSK